MPRRSGRRFALSEAVVRELMRFAGAVALGTILLSPIAGPAGAARAAAQDGTATQDGAATQDGETAPPKGTIEGPFEWRSTIYPGTVRRYWLYVPAQYDAAKPACVMVVQDGLGRAQGWKLIEAWDALIAAGEIPVQIGIMIEPGIVPADREGAQPRFNRSFEYDALGDRYARFLIEEILPEVGKSYPLSDDPNDAAIAGASSGGICAFTVAWERPDRFRRVLSTIGTYVSLRGGNEYPSLIRKMEPKPLRVFLQDGVNDLDLYGGNWFLSNQEMLAALEFAGYDVGHAWGEGGHDSQHSSEIMVDALRWVWEGHGTPIAQPHAPKRRTDILIEGEGWQKVSEGHGFTEGPAVDAEGRVLFADIPGDTIYRVDADGRTVPFIRDAQGPNGMMYGADGRLYVCQTKTSRIVAYDADGQESVVLEEAPANDLVMLADGGYYTAPDRKELWWFDPAGNRTKVAENLEGYPNGVITSADQTQLIVADTRGRFTTIFRIQEDHTLTAQQSFGHLHRGDQDGDTGADGMTVDDQDRVYVATRMGIQVLDPLGRVHLILSKPGPGWLSNCVFGGPDRDWLYVTCGTSVYRRRLQARGVVPWQPPVAPPRPAL